MKSPDRRSQVDKLIAESKPLEAAHELALLWKHDLSSSAFVASRYKIIGSDLPLTPCKLSVERSFTVEPIVPILRAGTLVSGIDLSVRLSPFNAYAQEILSPSSELYSFNPDIVILAVLTSDILPELWNGSQIASQGGHEKLVESVLEYFADLIEAHRAHSSSYLIIHSLERPSFPNRGILDYQLAHSQIAIIHLVNERLRALARSHRGIFVLDYDGLISRFGSLNWRDEAKWQSVRMPIKAEFHTSLVNEWLRFLYPMTGKIAKVAAVDLDNTIWGGIAGEDGLAGIRLGNEYPGVAFKAVQQALLDLRERGVLLAICSKNNPDDALEIFEKHPEMLLKLNHFSAIRINWQDKTANLRSIASELNLGVEALAFIDDNPVERQHVSSELPDVHVLDLPENALQYADAIRSFPPFERVVTSQGDEQRSASYAVQNVVAQLREKSETKEDFYRSLEQRVHIEPLNELTLPRVAQLTQKTNQFNLTTRRYTEQQIAQLVERSDWRSYTIRVIDRYVDNGLIGVALVKDLGEYWDIDTFLLSCRVIGRGIETALLSSIAHDARQAGKHFLEGSFIPTKKNSPAKEFYASHGFSLIEESSGQSHWRLDLRKSVIGWPGWIKLMAGEALAQ